MILPIRKKGFKIYGEDGEYILLHKDGNNIVYLFCPWDNPKIATHHIDPIPVLNEKLGVKLIWAVYDDIPTIEELTIPNNKFLSE